MLVSIGIILAVSRMLELQREKFRDCLIKTH
jgi:hypothetical protein